MVSFSAEKIDWAHSFKETSGKLSRKSRFFLCRDRLQININKETGNKSRLAISGIRQWKHSDCKQ